MHQLKAKSLTSKIKPVSIIPAFVYRRIAHRPNLVKIVDNIGWLFFDKILRMGMGLLVGVWVARYLGPEQFGLLNFATAFIGLFGAIAGLGLENVVVRDIVRDPESARLTLGTTAVLQLMGGLVTYLLILGTITYLRPDDALARTIVAILSTTLLFKVSEIAVYWFESQVQSKYTVWVQNSVFLIFAAVKVSLILLEAPLSAFVWAILGEAAMVASILLLVLNLRGPKVTQLQASMTRAKTLFKDSWPLLLSGLAVIIYMRTDQIMLGQMIGDEAVGIYSASVRISEVWYFIPIVIVASVFPTILKAKKRSEAEYYARLQKLYDLMVLVSISVALPMTFLATPLVRLLFGETYVAAGTVLGIHIWAAVFVFLGVASSKWFLAENRQMLSLKRTVFGAAINIFFNFFFIPHYGPNGAAVATIIANATAAYLIDITNKDTRRMFYMKTKSFNIFRPIIGSLFK